MSAYLSSLGGTKPGTAGTESGNNWNLLTLGLGYSIEPIVRENIPTAYLKYIFYDKEGKVVAGADNIYMLPSSASTGWEKLQMHFEAPQIKSKNGFCIIYFNLTRT